MVRQAEELCSLAVSQVKDAPSEPAHIHTQTFIHIPTILRVKARVGLQSAAACESTQRDCTGGLAVTTAIHHKPLAPTAGTHAHKHTHTTHNTCAQLMVSKSYLDSDCTDAFMMRVHHINDPIDVDIFQ